jgi:hypothetical protein
MACVQQLHQQHKRLPFGIEVVAFAEEEGQRYKATFLGSGALIGDFKAEWLEQQDADGISMRTAIGPSFILIAISPRFGATFRDFPLQEANHVEGAAIGQHSIVFGPLSTTDHRSRRRARDSTWSLWWCPMHSGRCLTEQPERRCVGVAIMQPQHIFTL